LPSPAHPDHPTPKAAAAVTLCGVCAFLELYCTQPILPLLAHIFHASKTGVGMTVSAATLGVAIAAPVFGALTERLSRKRVIVYSILGVSIPTLLAATSTSLVQLIFWRFLQGIMVPGIIAVVVTYIGEEWPPERVALIMSFYVSGTALGGFIGRISAGILADHFSWRISFLVLGLASLVGTSAVAAWLPPGRPRPQQNPSGTLPNFPQQVRAMFRNRRLIATFAVGFNVLFSLVGVFTWITFYLSAPPFSLSITALSSLFFVYLIGLIVTPFAGYLITRIGVPESAAPSPAPSPESSSPSSTPSRSSSSDSPPSPAESSSRKPPPRATSASPPLPALASPPPESTSPATTSAEPRPASSPEPSGPSANGPPS
jgi:MFS transporter, YNFM family, putative membrane transport protein